MVDVIAMRRGMSIVRGRGGGGVDTRIDIMIDMEVKGRDMEEEEGVMGMKEENSRDWGRTLLIM